MARRLALVVVAACGGAPPARLTPPPSPAPQPVSPPTSEDPPPPPSPPVGDAPRADVLRCDNVSTAELSIDGLLDDWKGSPIGARIGAAPDGSIAVRCAWDGSHLAIAVDVTDDKLIRVRSGRAHEDHVAFSLAAGGKPLRVDIFPGNAMAKPRVVGSGAEVADSLQPHGFSVELRAAASAIPGFSGSTPALDASVTFHDADRATGGDDAEIALVEPIELPDRKDLLDDFLRTVHLAKSDITLDQLAELDPDRAGKERMVAGGTVIGILTDRFAYVTMPAKPSRIELLPLGPRGQQVIAATVRQTGNGGSRDLLVLWTVWSGQLQPLKTFEIRKELAGNVLSCTYGVTKGKLVIVPQPAIGFTKDTYNEVPADDAEPILVPWADKATFYALKGAELEKVKR
jgi:hypothetical protein